MVVVKLGILNRIIHLFLQLIKKILFTKATLKVRSMLNFFNTFRQSLEYICTIPRSGVFCGQFINQQIFSQKHLNKKRRWAKRALVQLSNQNKSSAAHYV